MIYLFFDETDANYASGYGYYMSVDVGDVVGNRRHRARLGTEAGHTGVQGRI